MERWSAVSWFTGGVAGTRVGADIMDNHLFQRTSPSYVFINPEEGTTKKVTSILTEPGGPPPLPCPSGFICRLTCEIAHHFPYCLACQTDPSFKRQIRDQWRVL